MSMTKEEILKMPEEEIMQCKWSNDLSVVIDKCFDCFDCSNCFNCSDCSLCSDCFNCYACVNISHMEYAICNVVLSKEEYEAKVKELNQK